MTLRTFRSENEDYYGYKFSVLSMRASKNVCLQTLCACSVNTFRSKDEGDNYKYEFSVLSMRTSKNVGLQTLCACSIKTFRSEDEDGCEYKFSVLSMRMRSQI